MESILNVDDYTPGRYARTQMLRRAGFDVREAATGKEALQKAVEFLPSVILLDVNLPDISGFEVCKQIRRNPKTFATTVLHISATNVHSHQQVEGLECGADSYLVEPVDPLVLVATIKAFLRARQAEEALRRSNEELERFAYRVAHDLTEPLRTVITHSQLLQRDLAPQLNPNNVKGFQFVIDAATRMQSFMDGLLLYAKVTHSGGQIGEFDCEAILAQITADLKTTISESGAQITHDPLPTIAADPGLEQVFLNLISNAIKYRREGLRPEIHISGRSDGDAWLFSIRDNGIGVDPHHQHDIFRMFHRMHGREIPGSGIGLAMSKKIVEAHAGSIWVESEPGRGSTFYFRLPKTQAMPATTGTGH
jgi:two-component system sensor histidine kinase/response regulator